MAGHGVGEGVEVLRPPAKTWLADHAEIPVLDWVGQSCDLNPIENLWRELNLIIAGIEAATNLDDLAKKIARAWKILGRRTEYLYAWY